MLQNGNILFGTDEILGSYKILRKLENKIEIYDLPQVAEDEQIACHELPGAHVTADPTAGQTAILKMMVHTQMPWISIITSSSQKLDHATLPGSSV